MPSQCIYKFAGLTLLGVLASVFSAGAQNKAPQQSPKTPESVVVQGTMTPDRADAELETFAKKRQETGGPTERGQFFNIAYAANPNEFAALGRYSVMLLSVLTQKTEELPVSRVYIRANGNDVPVRKVSSWRSEGDDKLIAYKIYGRYREDGFYLLPTGMLMRDGQLLIDLAANRTAWAILQLPGKAALQRVKQFPNPDPAPNAKPDLKALQAFIARQYRGFPVPKSLP